MANKLYEENSIADIADAIRSINGKQDTYTVSQMGEAIRSVRKVYTGTITETVVGDEATVACAKISCDVGVYAVLAKDAFLAEHRADENLFIRIEFDVEPQPYTIVKNWGVNTPYEVMPVERTQIAYRYGSSATTSIGYPACTFASDAPSGVGSVLISEEGELRIYSSSSNYAIRPSTYTVIVEC